MRSKLALWGVLPLLAFVAWTPGCKSPKDGDPLLHRIVITYSEEEGQPQFWANLTDWNLTPNNAPSTFLFQPPAGTEEILFNSINPQREE